MKEKYNMQLIIKELDKNAKEVLNEHIITGDSTRFVWDGCHKIYLVETEQDVLDVKELCGEDEILYPLEDLPRIWRQSCPLKFISNFSLTKQFVHQFNEATFTFIVDGCEEEL